MQHRQTRYRFINYLIISKLSAGWEPLICRKGLFVNETFTLFSVICCEQETGNTPSSPLITVNMLLSKHYKYINMFP